MGREAADAGWDALPFTDETVRLLEEARMESERLKHEFLGTEHLLLALINTDSIAAPSVTLLAIDRNKIRDALEPLLAPGNAGLPPGADRPLTTRTRKSISFGAGAARDLGRSLIAPEHLMIGIMRERLNPAAQVLHHVGLTVDAVIALARARSD